jgi:hypothetical protein
MVKFSSAMSAIGTSGHFNHGSRMFAFGGKADIASDVGECPVMTQSGHAFAADGID